jgi:hypothetical protein
MQALKNLPQMFVSILEERNVQHSFHNYSRLLRVARVLCALVKISIKKRVFIGGALALILIQLLRNYYYSESGNIIIIIITDYYY